MSLLYTHVRTWLFGILLLGVSLAATAQDIWTQKASFGGVRYGAVGFNIGSKGYIGTGTAGSSAASDFWEYNPVADTWTQKANYGGGGRAYAIGFSIGSKGYIGTGSATTNTGGTTSDFWEYNPAANAWTRKADFGGGTRSSAVGFSIGSKGYIGTGVNSGGSNTNDFWAYDPTADAWTRKTDFGGSSRTYAAGFSIGTKGYLGTGFNANNFLNDFWEYDATANAWAQKANFGGTARDLAVGFSIGNQGYLGTGFGLGNAFFADFWQFDPTTNAWTQKAAFGGGARCWSAGFAIGSKGYLGTGFTANYTFANDLWEYASAATISTSSIAPGALCASGSLAVGFSVTGAFAAGNVFTAQLSDASGSFTSPTAIGMLAGTASGSISATIPTNTPAGSGYRIRVVSSAPAITGTDNGSDLTVNTAPVVTVPGAVTTTTDAGVCGASVSFAATATGTAPTLTYAIGSTPITSPYVFPVGTTTVTATATNSCGTDSKTFDVTVSDVTAPTAVAQNVSLPLNASGMVTLSATQANNGSSDNCSVASVALLGMQEFFTNGTFNTNTAGWTLTNIDGNGGYRSSGGNPGGYFIINDNGRVGIDPTLSQTISGLTPGSSYLISGSYRNIYGIGGPIGAQAFAVDLDGTELTTFPNPGQVWTPFSLRFTAAGTSQTIAFRAEIGTTDIDIAVDNLSVRALVPSLSFGCADVRTNAATLVAIDASGNTGTAGFTATVSDVTVPIAVAQNVTVTLVNGAASVTAAQVNDGSSDACGIASLALDRMNFTCANIGDNNVVLTVTDTHGNMSTAPAVVHVTGSMPVPGVTVIPANNVYTGGIPNNLYLGYGPQSVTLAATGGVSYSWAALNPADLIYLSSSTSASPVFTAPTTSGTFTYTVTATNSYGCTGIYTVTLNVIDARCDKNKVIVCHGGNALCVAASAVPAHLLNHTGDKLGACTGPALRSGAAPGQGATELAVYPNPVAEQATVSFRAPLDGQGRMDVYNEMGQRVATIYDGAVQGGQLYSLTLKTQDLTTGLYMCRLILNGKAETMRLTVAH